MLLRFLAEQLSAVLGMCLRSALRAWRIGPSDLRRFVTKKRTHYRDAAQHGPQPAAGRQTDLGSMRASGPAWMIPYDGHPLSMGCLHPPFRARNDPFYADREPDLDS